ncbi:OsmC family protein [Rhodoblastus sp.]|uniref:OsmC family protein n=1 Tax=Rhodoblastus sp. TaxID=1962975 RepID=UPI003F9A48B0
MNAKVVARQTRLQQRYREAPEEALIIERARTTDGVLHDPFHGHVEIGDGDPRGVPEQGFEFGIHSAVGGDHDLPNPGHLLAGALAACMDATLRMLAERIGVRLAALEVAVDAHVDARGALMVSAEAPVGFKNMHCCVTLRPAEGAPQAAIERLLTATERCCVNFQTLQNGVPITTSLSVLESA